MRWMAWVRRGQSSSSRRPVRSRCWSSRPTEPSIRMASCTPAISIENTATGRPCSTATCSPMFSENAVLPIDGRPATMIRSPACMPLVILSRSMKPVGTPVTSVAVSRWYNSSIRSTTCVSSGWISWKPFWPREPSSAIAKTLDSASSSSSRTSRPFGAKAAEAMSSATVTSLRSTERSRTISA
ncbi:hypothetical protein D3C85_1313220 [compost metagenome]